MLSRAEIFSIDLNSFYPQTQFFMDVTITLLSGESHPLTVAPGTTVGLLKDLISQRLQLSPESQKLLTKTGKKITLDNPLTSLSAYGVPPSANIFVLVKKPTTIQVFLKTMRGQTHTYTLQPGETVAGFNLKVAEREKLAEDQQRLIYEGKQLDVESRTLESYNVRKGSTIYQTTRLRD